MSDPVDIGERPKVDDQITLPHKGDGLPILKGKGLLRAPDVRDGRFRYAEMRRQLRAAQPVERRTFRNWSVDAKRLPLDQGPTPRCVGYSIATAAVVGPNTQRKRLPTAETADLFANLTYEFALSVDEWEGEDPDYGTSVRAGFKAAISGGLIASYAWGESVDDLAEFVLNHGPAVIGVLWPDSFLRPDAKGFVSIDPASTMDGRHAAGHAIAVVGVNLKERNPDKTIGNFTLLNSWGKGWGYKGTGRVRMSFRTVGALIVAGADLGFPTEVELEPVRLAPVPG